jgi:hypothetical protein
MTGGGAISPKYFRAIRLEITDKVRYYGWKIREGEALKKGYNEKQEMILSQRQKEAVTVGQASYYGWNFLQARYYGWTFFWTGVLRRG